VSGRGSIVAVIRPIADGVGVKCGGAEGSTLRLLRGDGVAGGGISAASFVLLCASRMWSLVEEEEDNLADLRVDMMILLGLRRLEIFNSINSA
jgi:hypothetical protein